MIKVKDDNRQALDTNLLESLQGNEVQPKDYIVCALCSNVVTEANMAIELGGNFRHQVTNPHGFEFTLGCYRQALGCNIQGQREHADSWFPGYQWRLANCADCLQHLGWYFDASSSQAQGDFFYGLILDRIAPA